MIQFKKVYLNYEACNLSQLFTTVCDQLESEGIITSAFAVSSGLEERELVVPTLFENGVGIPHTSNEHIKETTLVLITSKQGILYRDGRLANLVIFLLTPINSGKNHLAMMSELSTVLLNRERVKIIVNESDYSQIGSLFNSEHTPGSKLGVKETRVVAEPKPLVLAITACTTGIAHTYIAASALEQAGGELNVNIHVERQGANGIENEIRQSDIDQAVSVIVAADVEVEGMERFEHLPQIVTKVADPIENSRQLITKALVKNDEEVKMKSSNSNSLITGALLADFSKIIPITTLAIIILGISNISDSQFLKICSDLLLTISFLIFCGELTKNIGTKSAYPFGLLIALFNIQLNKPDIYHTNMFIAVLSAIGIGLVYRYLLNKIKVPRNLVALKVHLIMPVIILAILLPLEAYVIMPLSAYLNSNQVVLPPPILSLLTILVVIGICYDYGGPVNKLTNLIATGFAFSSVIPLTACNLAIVIPPVGMAILKFLTTGKNTFANSEYQSSKNLLISGLLATSEGVKPFVKNYRHIWAVNIIGTLVGVLLAQSLGAVADYPLPAVWAWIFVDNIPAYVIGFGVGALFIAIGNYIIINYKLGAEK